MKCPDCSAETSDMLATCEWCGARLLQGGPSQAIPYAGPTDPQPQYQQPAYQQGPGQQVPYQQPPYQPAPGEMPPPPSDASYHGYGQRPTGPQPKPKNPWYATPVPYAIAIVVVLAIIASVVVLHKGAKGNTALLVNNLPTMIDLYTDT